MGTSNGNRGQDGRTPLVPSWLPADAPLPLPQPQPTPPATAPPPPVPMTPAIPIFPPLPPIAAADRFTAARNNFSRFVGSGGSDRRSLGRALSQYISTGAGGSRVAAQRMGSSRTSGAQLAGFLSNAVANGPREALRALNLQNLAGRPIEEVFVGLIDYVCPEGGSLDEGIAREAFIETIADLADNGVVNFDNLSVDQMQTILELYATHAIETRLCNDIGTNAITLPADAAQAASLQRQLLDFVRRSVADAITRAREAMLTLTPERVSAFVTRVYEEAWRVLQSLGEAEVDTA
jgi:hypothetical protein